MKRVLTVILILVTSGCAERQTPWDRLMAEKTLRFVTIEGPATYYTSPSGPMGLEYELAKKFADKLGVGLKVLVVPNAYQVVTTIQDGKASIGGAALLSNTRLGELRFGPAYLKVPQQLVYRRGEKRPASLRDLSEQSINISTSHLVQIKDRYPHFVWNATYDKDVQRLLKLIQEEEVSSAIATSNMVDIYKHLYPDIRVAFDITPPQPLAWVYRRNENRLHDAITSFFGSISRNGELEKLVNYYYGHINDFDYVDIRTYLRRIEELLPRYEKVFKKYGEKHDLDWTLLAAMSYQESQWKADARSPTGVRGLMMLTQDTAGQLGIKNRLSPEQSVDGGARYLKLLMEKIPERIKHPDRLWFALAAYNVGFQHLEDARILAQKDGADPDRWNVVRQYLPLLSDEEWYKKTRYGFARGNEPVSYVRKVRIYQDVLRWIQYEKNKIRTRKPPLQALFINAPAL